jgi:uncharacterized OsmC-like protein
MGIRDLEDLDSFAAAGDMCPVHRTLHGEIKVRTTLA